MKGITKRQSQLLDFIRSSIESTGKSPTYRAMSAHLGCVSPNASIKHIESMERKGVLVRSDGGIKLCQ